MSNIVICADIHFGVQNKTQDILWACKVVREYCKRFNISTIIVLGDLYHDRSAIDIDVMCVTSKFFEECYEEYDQKWIIFPGNHDMYLRHSWDITSLVPLRKHLTVIEDVKLLTLNDKRFWILPFIQHEKAYMRILRAIESKHEEDDILLTHIGVCGAILNTCFLLKDWSHVRFDSSKFTKIYTGHFHSNQSVGENVWYPGSLIPFKFDEGDVPHGFFVHNLDDNSHKFIDIWKAGEKLLEDNTKPPPQFRTIEDNKLQTTPIEKFKNNIIRVALNREYTIQEKQVIKDKLLEHGAIDIRWMNQSTRIKKSDADILHSAIPSRNLFNAWIEIDKKGIQDLDIKLLHHAHDDIVASGDELYIAEEHEF